MFRISKPVRIALRLLAGVYLFLVIGLMVTDRYLQYRSSDDEILRYYVKRQLPIHIGYYQAQGREMRYLSSGNDPSKPVLFFIHGAPSSSNYYRHFLSDTGLRRMANLIAVDRPGYGYSGFGKPVADMGMQAAMIAPILDSLHKGSRPVILVGSSYGTPIASRLLMDYPHIADGLVLIAPALAPGEEKTYWVSYLLESPLFTWAQPRMLHTANVEKFTHREELEKMRNRWHEIEVPVMYFQGANDDLIYTSNALFARNNITKCECIDIRLIPNRGHLIVYNEAKRIRKAMVEMMQLSAQFFAERQATQGAWQAELSEEDR